MSVVIFILVLIALILVHELGHFIAAKLSGMRVDEFGLGYPPKVWSIKRGETEYSVNALPFGGFVKIYGESLEEGGGARSFGKRPRILQTFVLVAGIAMNLLFAYVLITGALISGTPRALTPEEVGSAPDATLAVARILPGSPAEHAGLIPGDHIVRIDTDEGNWSGTDPEAFTSFVRGAGTETLMLAVQREDKLFSVEATPVPGLIESDPSRPALGVEVVTIGTVRVPVLQALSDGAVLTWAATKATAVGLVQFFARAFTFTADLSQVAGPVGIAHAVGTASTEGLGDLLSLTAIISINLALINLVPIPALDGGRLLFVIIESVIRRPIRPRVAQAMNGIGFALLLLLMVVVTAHDIFRLVG